MKPRFTALEVAMVAVLPMVVAAACTGTETGNGFTQELRVGAHSTNPSDYAVMTAEGGGVVTEAWIIVGGMTLVADGNCGGGGDGVDMPALGVDDHAAGLVDLTIEMEAGDFCQLSVPIGGDASIPTGAPPQIGAENGIVLIGETAGGTEFTIVGGAPTLALTGGVGFALDEETGDLFLGFDVASWLAGLDIDNGDVTGGRVLIDATNNATLSAAFEANLPGGIELYGDANGNGVVDAGEQAIAAGQ